MQNHLPQEQVRSSPEWAQRKKPIPPGKTWKYFLSFPRSCAELWLQQTWGMIIVPGCLWKGLFHAKQLSWLGIKSKEPLIIWGWAVHRYLLAKHDEVRPTWHQLCHPSSQGTARPVILCGQRCWQLGCTGRWKLFCNYHGTPCAIFW